MSVNKIYWFINHSKIYYVDIINDFWQEVVKEKLHSKLLWGK